MNSDDYPLDVFKIADILIAHALETHRDEIDLVAYYGSYAQGKAKQSSDLDIFYIPAEGSNPNVGRTFLLEGILFDFWGISWDTMEGFATGRVRGWSFAPAIVQHAKVLHARSDEHMQRFAALKQKGLDLQKPEARPQMIQRALDEFTSTLAHLGNLRLAAAGGDFSDIRYAGWKVILSVWECLALANQVFFERGWSDLIEQIPRFHNRPEELETLIITISTSNNPVLICGAAEKLVMDTRQVLREYQKTLPSKQTPREAFDSVYPEIKDGIGKILSACERQQPVSASASAWFAQYDLVLMLNALQFSTDHSKFNLYNEFSALYRQLGFPDLMRIPMGDLTTLEQQARLLDEQIRNWLQNQTVDLCEFESLEEL